MQIHYVGTNIFCSEWSTNLFLFHYLLYFKNINYFRLNISGYLLSKMKLNELKSHIGFWWINTITMQPGSAGNG